MAPEQFNHYALQGYNRIPVSREVLADLDTPLSAYLKLADGAYSYLFESVHGGEQWGRYSIIGLPCKTVVKISGNQICVEKDGELLEAVTHDNPLVWIEQFKLRYKVPDIAELPRFNGGLVGYFGYETIHYIEPRLRGAEKPDPLGCPDILLMVSEEILVFDNLSGKVLLLTHANPEEADAYERAVCAYPSWLSGCATCPPNPKITPAPERLKSPILFPVLPSKVMKMPCARPRTTLPTAI